MKIYRHAPKKRTMSPLIQYLLLMKLSVFIVLFTTFQCIAGSGRGQDRISIDLKNVTIETVLTKIASQSNYNFVYKDDILPKDLKLNVYAKDAGIDYVMEKILAETRLEYKRTAAHLITIIKKMDKIEYPPSWVLRGTVLNENRNPIIGATVSVKGTPKATSTNSEGVFLIEVESAQDSIIISYLGYKTLTVVAGAQKETTYQLAPDLEAQEMNEVIVVGFGEQKKSTVVSSVSTIKGDDLRFGGRNLSNNLQGQVSGLIAFQRSGEPGYDNATFWIRGISTYNGVQNPLVLVDGVPRNFNDIDPNEIETFSVLKDAAATAVFGAEGANGVILVTTKRGKTQKTQITYRGEMSTLSPFRMPEFVGAPEFMETYNEAKRNEGQPNFFTQGRIDSTRQQLDPDLYPDVNWLDVLIKNRTSNTRHNLSFRGGTDKARYYVSTAYYSESGIFKNNALSQYSSNINLKRYNLRSNIDLDVTNTTLLKINLSGQYVTTNYPGAGTSKIFEVASFAPPYLYPPVYSDGKAASHPNPSGNRSNPYNLLNNSGYSNEFRTMLQSYIGLEQKLDAFTKGLSAKVGISYDFNGTFIARTGKSISSYSAEGRDPVTGAIIYNTEENGSGELTDGGTTFSTNRNIYMEGSLNYARLFATKHDVGAMALVYRKERVRQEGGINLITRLPNRIQGYVGRVTYAYNRRYSAEVNVGITGSEQFAEGHQYGMFPAAGVAWIISNEPYYPEGLKNIISTFKLRASAGLTGNDDVGKDANDNPLRFLYRGGFQGGPGFALGYNAGGSLGSLGGYIEDQFAAPELSWEREMKRNYAIDLGFWRNKINLTVEVYNNLRTDILLRRQTVSQVAGFRESPWQNFGTVSNKGFDASITANHQIGDHSFGVRGNYAFARNKILERDEVPQLYPYMNETGQSLNTPYIYQADRLFTDDDFTITTDGGGNKQYALKPGTPSQQYFGADANLRPGDVKYVDLNGDGIIDQFDRSRELSKPTSPEIVYGFGASYGYKGFSISVFFSGVANTQAILGSDVPQGFFPFRFNVDETSVRTIARDRWTEENPSQDVLFPRIRTGNNNNNETGSTWWLRDMSFLRLKNVELGYNLPQKITNRIGMSNARLFLLGFNLYTWDKLKLWDPEQGAKNSGMTYPQSRTITLGVQLTLK